MKNPTEQTELVLKDAFDLYENGKHRRYNLLFTVNGGAFAIAKLLTDHSGENKVLGGLSLQHLGFGMIIFTGIMVWDIYGFGEKMRDSYLKDAFGVQGKIVLVLLGLLLITGWVLAVGAN